MVTIMARKRTPFAAAVRKCCVALYRAEVGVDAGKSRQQIYVEHGDRSPRFLCAVAAELHDIRCRQALNALDSLARIEAKRPDGERDLRKFRRSLARASFDWLIAELRRRRRAQANYADIFKHQSLAGALTPADAASARPGEGEVIVYTPPSTSFARRDDVAHKALSRALSGPMPLARANGRHHLDELFSRAYTEAPWMAAPLEWLWRHNIALLDDRLPRLDIPPMLLVGPPASARRTLRDACVSCSVCIMRAWT